MADTLRRTVLWFGAEPSPETSRELRTRHLSVVKLTASPMPEQIAAACGAVFSFESSNINAVAVLASELAALLIDNGLRIELVATSDRVFGQAQARLGVVTTLRDVHARTAPAPHELPE